MNRRWIAAGIAVALTIPLARFLVGRIERLTGTNVPFVFPGRGWKVGGTPNRSQLPVVREFSIDGKSVAIRDLTASVTFSGAKHVIDVKAFIRIAPRGDTSRSKNHMIVFDYVDREVSPGEWSGSQYFWALSNFHGHAPVESEFTILSPLRLQPSNLKSSSTRNDITLDLDGWVRPHARSGASSVAFMVEAADECGVTCKSITLESFDATLVRPSKRENIVGLSAKGRYFSRMAVLTAGTRPTSGPPSAAWVTPNPGSASEQNFALMFSDATGATTDDQSIAQVRLVKKGCETLTICGLPLTSIQAAWDSMLMFDVRGDAGTLERFATQSETSMLANLRSQDAVASGWYSLDLSDMQQTENGRIDLEFESNDGEHKRIVLARSAAKPNTHIAWIYFNRPGMVSLATTACERQPKLHGIGYGTLAGAFHEINFEGSDLKIFMLREILAIGVIIITFSVSHVIAYRVICVLPRRRKRKAEHEIDMLLTFSKWTSIACYLIWTVKDILAGVGIVLVT